jgi:hypothetical protein
VAQFSTGLDNPAGSQRRVDSFDARTTARAELRRATWLLRVRGLSGGVTDEQIANCDLGSIWRGRVCGACALGLV